MIIKALSPGNWNDYELIDCGNFEKLERFGKYILIRPEPQAIWPKLQPELFWQDKHHIKYIAQGHNTGKWIKKNNDIADSWVISYANKIVNIKIKLALTSFKHVGCFPEQACNWDYLTTTIPKIQNRAPKILNLFAYTGVASIISSKLQSEVWHVDAVKQVNNWAKENEKLSNANNIHLIQEDVIKYLKRCIKRQIKFNGVIMDPPAYGIGPNKERWKLNENIQELVALVSKVLDKEYFIILNCYALGMSALSIHNLLSTIDKQSKPEIGELFLPDANNCNLLPLGVYGRISNI